MRNLTSSFFLLAVLSVAFVLLSHESTAAEKPNSDLPKGYASPGAVFEAYRVAHEKQDYRTVFFCLTPESQELAVFETYFAANMHLNNPKMVAVLKQYGVEEKGIEGEYYKRYWDKHGIDLAKVIADQEKAREKAKKSPEKQKNAPTQGIAVRLVPAPEGEPGNARPSLPPTDQDLLQKALLARIADRAGFVAAVEKVLANKEGHPGFSKLENLTIQGDTATGCANTIIDHWEAEQGKPEKKVGDVVKVTFHFRKWKGSWFIHIGEDNWTPQQSPPIGTTPERKKEKPTTFVR